MPADGHVGLIYPPALLHSAPGKQCMRAGRAQRGAQGAGRRGKKSIFLCQAQDLREYPKQAYHVAYPFHRGGNRVWERISNQTIGQAKRTREPGTMASVSGLLYQEAPCCSLLPVTSCHQIQTLFAQGSQFCKLPASSW